MIHFTFSTKDNRYLFLKFDNDSDYETLLKLQKAINLVDPICYLPQYTGMPFTQDFLWEYRQKSGDIIFYCSIGLWSTIWKWFKMNNIEYDGLDPNMFKNNLKHSFEEFCAIVDSWGLKFKPRPYQYEIAYKILSWKRSIVSAATRAGKTLTAYIVFRYAMEYLNAKKILMIVPSIELVKQGYSDFSEYAEFFKTECVWGGGKLVESSNMTIGTFQSLIKFIDPKDKKYNPEFYKDYDVVFVDETHRATARNIKSIIAQPFMRNVKISFGMTGTLPKEWTIERYCIESLLGAKIAEITPKQLMDEGYISNIKIYQHRIFYKDEQKQINNWIKCAEYSLSEDITTLNAKGKKIAVKRENPEFLLANMNEMPFGLQQAKMHIYSTTESKKEKDEAYLKLLKNTVKSDNGATMLHIETMTVHFMDERIDYLCEVLKKCPNNTLVLATHVEYIKHVAKKVQEKFPERHVIAIYGNSKERKTLKETLKKFNDCIVIGNYGIMSTGITLANLCYGVFFESYKSPTIVLQSLGRGLGLSEMKTKYILHDITDCFNPKITGAKILAQGKERIKIYTEQQFEHEIVKRVI